MALTRTKRLSAMLFMLGVIGVGAVTFFAWRSGWLPRDTASIAPALESASAPVEKVTSAATAPAPIGEIFSTLTREALLPKFQPCIQGVDWELLMAEPFQQGGKSYALVVFANYQKDEEGKRYEGHGQGAALLPALFSSEPSGGWRCLEFKDKFIDSGAWGNAGEVFLWRLGPDRWGLKVSSGFSNQGETSSHSSYFELGAPVAAGHPPTLALNEVLTIQESLLDENEGREQDWKAETVFTSNVVNEHFVVNVKITGKASSKSLEAAGDYEFSPMACKHKKAKQKPLDNPSTL